MFNSPQLYVDGILNSPHFFLTWITCGSKKYKGRPEWGKLPDDKAKGSQSPHPCWEQFPLSTLDRQHIVNFRASVEEGKGTGFQPLWCLKSCLYSHVWDSQAPKFTLYVMVKQNEKSKRKVRALKASAWPGYMFQSEKYLGNMRVM